MRRLIPVEGSTKTSVAWLLFDKDSLKYTEGPGQTCGSSEMPIVPSGERAGKYLMRVLVDPTAFSEDGYCEVDMVSARSHPHETVWSETEDAIKMRQFIAEHRPLWPS